LPSLRHFDQLVLLLQIFHLLAESNETELLKAQPIASASMIKEQQRLHKVYQFIVTHYQKDVDVNEVAGNMSSDNGGICRYI
jgi:hypothetical protein